MSTSKEEFLNKGFEYIKSTCDEMSDYQKGLKQIPELSDIITSNECILSDSILSNSDIPGVISSKIRDYCSEMRLIIESTAAHIEKEKFETVEQAVEDIRVGIAEKRMLQDLLKAQQKVSFSFTTIDIATDIFLRINESLIDQLNNTSLSRESNKYYDLMLKNAIIIYEFTDFLINYLKNHSILGRDDIEKVKRAVEEKIEKSEENNKLIEEKIEAFKKDSEFEKDSEITEEATTEVKQSRSIAKMSRDRWSKFDEKMAYLQDEFESIKKVIPELELKNLTAKARLYNLDIVMMIRSFKANIKLINKVADVKKFKLQPFSINDAKELLGIDHTTKTIESGVIK